MIPGQDLTRVWVWTEPHVAERGDNLRHHVLSVDADLTRTAKEWRAAGHPEHIRTFGASFGVFYGLRWTRSL